MAIVEAVAPCGTTTIIQAMFEFKVVVPASLCMFMVHLNPVSVKGYVTVLNVDAALAAPTAAWTKQIRVLLIARRADLVGTCLLG